MISVIALKPSQCRNHSCQFNFKPIVQRTPQTTPLEVSEKQKMQPSHSLADPRPPGIALRKRSKIASGPRSLETRWANRKVANAPNTNRNQDINWRGGNRLRRDRAAQRLRCFRDSIDFCEARPLRVLPLDRRALRRDFVAEARLTVCFEEGIVGLGSFVRPRRCVAAAFPAKAPTAPPTTAPTGPATLPIAAPAMAPAVCFGIGGTRMSLDVCKLCFFFGFRESVIKKGPH
jgi:hypothetical protein